MRPHVKPTALLLGCFLIISAGCTKSPPLPKADTPAPAVQGVGAPVTEDEARQFADKLSQLVKAGDVPSINRLLHITSLIKRLVTDLNFSAEERQDFLKGALQSPDEGRLGAVILRSIADGGSYKLLHIHMVAGRPRAMFRQINAGGGVTYHDFILTRFPDGVGMEDVYLTHTGELFSQTTRRLMIPALAEQRRGGQVKGSEAIYLKSFPTFSALTQAMRKGQFTEAIAHYRKLPEQLQENKWMLVAYLNALSRQEDTPAQDYRAAVEKFRKLYPSDEAALDLISMDYYGRREKYDEALKAVDRLDRAVSGDPFLNSMRGNLLAGAKRFKEARAVAERAIKDEPTLEDAYWVRISVSLRERNYADTLEWLKKMVQACQAPVEDLAANSEYAGFIQSPQYREWQKWYQARVKK